MNSKISGVMVDPDVLFAKKEEMLIGILVILFGRAVKKAIRTNQSVADAGLCEVLKRQSPGCKCLIPIPDRDRRLVRREFASKPAAIQPVDKETTMISLSRSALFLSCLSLLLFLTAACGAGGLEGTYSTSAGNVVLELRSGGKANFTIMGETQACTWKADDSKVVLTCKGDSVNLVRHDDGSLSGPGFVGQMKKSK